MKIDKKKLIFIFIICSLAFLILDFVKFYKSIFSFQNDIRPNGNLVVLTGGTNRIKQTLGIFFNQSSIKYQLLISGAGKGFNKKIVSRFLPQNNLSKKILKCCVSIENLSTNTKSNALETLKWAKEKDIRSFTLITSDYHMPRALIEFKTVFKDITIKPYILKTNNVNIITIYKNYFEEYLKFLIVRMGFFLKIIY